MDFSNGPTLDCVIQMNLVIPFFHSEFDALQLLIKRFGKNHYFEKQPFLIFGVFYMIFGDFDQRKIILGHFTPGFGGSQG